MQDQLLDFAERETRSGTQIFILTLPLSVAQVGMDNAFSLHSLLLSLGHVTYKTQVEPLRGMLGPLSVNQQCLVCYESRRLPLREDLPSLRKKLSLSNNLTSPASGC